MRRWIARGSRHSGAGAGSYTEASQPFWIRRPMTVQVIAFVIDQLGVTRSAAPNSLYRSHKMRSGAAIRTPYAPVERAKKASIARATSAGEAGGVSTASPSGQARPASGRLRE